MRSSRFGRRRLSVLVTAALAAALTSCASGEDGRVGDTARAAADVEADGAARTVVVPTGVVTVTVGTAAREVPASQIAGGGDGVRAPADASVVPVAVDFAPGTGTVAGVGLLPGTTPLPTTVSLSVGGTQVEVGAPYVVAGDAPQPDPHTDWVVVPGDGTGIVLQVGFDGLTQRIDLDSGEEDLGAAASFADSGEAPLTGERTCPSTGWTGSGADGDVEARVSCTAAASGSLPWAPGVGWAADAEEGWRVVLVDAAITAVTGAEPPGSLAGLILDGDLDGATPADTAVVTPSSTSSGATALRWVFPVEPGGDGVLRLRLAYGTDQSAARVDLGKAVDLGDG